ncbi:MAG: hypothetical protein ABI995_03510, partial [Acidobacteriota bacterium]
MTHSTAASTFAALLFTLVPATAQTAVQLRDNSDQQLSCNSDRSYARYSRFCEMREQTVSGTGRFDIDGVHNGSVTVRGWNRNDVQVRLRVETEARSDSRAREVASRVHTDIRSGRVMIDGPDWESILNEIFDNEGWSVSAEI